MSTEPEYECSVTLIILGNNLEPDCISEKLSLKPSQSWRKGELKEIERNDGSKLSFDSRNEYGGWKLFTAPEHKDDSLEVQLYCWIQILQDKVDNQNQYSKS